MSVQRMPVHAWQENDPVSGRSPVQDALGILPGLFLVVYLSPNFLSCLLLVKEILNAAVWSTLCHLVIVMGIVRGT